MFFYRLRRILLERDVLVSVIVLGVMMMIADAFGDFDFKMTAAIIRILGVAFLIAVFMVDQWARQRKSEFKVPLMFTNEASCQARRAMFGGFLDAADLQTPLKIILASSPVRDEDVIIPIESSIRQTSDQAVWRNAWRNALRDWEENVERPLLATPFNESRCYHIFPHAFLPMSFALGASVNLRRSIILYHKQDDASETRRVLDLSNPRGLSDPPDEATPHPKLVQMPDEIAPSSRKKKLILHLAISSRHPLALRNHPDHASSDNLSWQVRHGMVWRGRDHPDHASSDNVALYYDFDLDPKPDWLPFAQRLFAGAKQLVVDYEQVDICLMMPSVVAFALGMAFSRNSRITVCHRLNDQYLPVFSLAEIEKRLPFD